MMKIHIGVTHITSNFSKLSAEVKERMTGLIRETTEQVATEYRQAITTGGRSGREYGGHRASAPGEPPASLTGELVESVTTEYPSEDKGIMKVGAFFSRMLEFGTHHAAARPVLRPLMERIGLEYRRKANRVVGDAARDSEVR